MAAMMDIELSPLNMIDVYRPHQLQDKTKAPRFMFVGGSPVPSKVTF